MMQVIECLLCYPMVIISFNDCIDCIPHSPNMPASINAHRYTERFYDNCYDNSHILACCFGKNFTSGGSDPRRLMQINAIPT
jgi:hypothetical protein